MSNIDNFESLFKTTEDLTPEKIILKFFESGDIDLKTEIPARMMMAIVILEAMSPYYKDLGLTQLSKLIDAICKSLKDKMVSLDRKGRGEGERMLGAIRQQLQSKGVLSELLGVGKWANQKNIE